jgi:hypothetical protein
VYFRLFVAWSSSNFRSQPSKAQDQSLDETSDDWIILVAIHIDWSSSLEFRRDVAVGPKSSVVTALFLSRFDSINTPRVKDTTSFKLRIMLDTI